MNGTRKTRGDGLCDSGHTLLALILENVHKRVKDACGVCEFFSLCNDIHRHTFDSLLWHVYLCINGGTMCTKVRECGRHLISSQNEYLVLVRTSATAIILFMRINGEATTIDVTAFSVSAAALMGHCLTRVAYKNYISSHVCAYDAPHFRFDFALFSHAQCTHIVLWTFHSLRFRVRRSLRFVLAACVCGRLCHGKWFFFLFLFSRAFYFIECVIIIMAITSSTKCIAIPKKRSQFERVTDVATGARKNKLECVADIIFLVSWTLFMCPCVLPSIKIIIKIKRKRIKQKNTCDIQCYATVSLRHRHLNCTKRAPKRRKRTGNLFLLLFPKVLYVSRVFFRLFSVRLWNVTEGWRSRQDAEDECNRKKTSRKCAFYLP